jgi:predicted CXXCH cytochrome family protein
MKRLQKGAIFIFFLFTVCISFFAVQCTPVKKYQVLSFFFDGVPDPNKKTEVLTPVHDTVIVAATKPEFYTHKPYEEEKCKSCHAEGYSNALLKPLPELCYTCHEDFNNKYPSVHGPVASGNCLTCHNQHMAKNEKLLIRAGRDLCLFCHNSKQILTSEIHKRIEDKNCTECHNPHGGNNRGMLKDGSCYTCHADFATKYSVLHGPVASGSCTGCHDSHCSKVPKLLLREKQQLCLFCHNSEQIFKNPAHKKLKKGSDCIECHNPHGGEERYNLIESLRPLKPVLPPPVKHKADTDTSAQAKGLNTIHVDTLHDPAVVPVKKQKSEGVNRLGSGKSGNEKVSTNEKTDSIVEQKRPVESVKKAVPAGNPVRDSSGTVNKPAIHQEKIVEPILPASSIGMKETTMPRTSVKQQDSSAISQVAPSGIIKGAIVPDAISSTDKEKGVSDKQGRKANSKPSLSGKKQNAELKGNKNGAKQYVKTPGSSSHTTTKNHLTVAKSASQSKPLPVHKNTSHPKIVRAKPLTPAQVKPQVASSNKAGMRKEMKEADSSKLLGSVSRKGMMSAVLGGKRRLSNKKRRQISTTSKNSHATIAHNNVKGKAGAAHPVHRNSGVAHTARPGQIHSSAQRKPVNPVRKKSSVNSKKKKSSQGTKKSHHKPVKKKVNRTTSSHVLNDSPFRRNGHAMKLMSMIDRNRSRKMPDQEISPKFRTS